MILRNVHAMMHRRRVHMLTQHLAPLLPHNAKVLDVGCGDGMLAAALMQQRPDLKIIGIDVLTRADMMIPVQHFNGHRIPLRGKSVDVVLLIDMLHHMESPMTMLREATRVTRKAIIIKDHLRHGKVSAFVLRMMDWVGNARHGVALPYNYWSEQQWRIAFSTHRLRIRAWVQRLALYPWPVTLLFDRNLHFLVQLETGKSKW